MHPMPLCGWSRNEATGAATTHNLGLGCLYLDPLSCHCGSASVSTVYAHFGAADRVKCIEIGHSNEKISNKNFHQNIFNKIVPSIFIGNFFLEKILIIETFFIGRFFDWKAASTFFGAPIVPWLVKLTHFWSQTAPFSSHFWGFQRHKGPKGAVHGPTTPFLPSVVVNCTHHFPIISNSGRSFIQHPIFLETWMPFLLSTECRGKFRSQQVITGNSHINFELAIVQMQRSEKTCILYAVCVKVRTTQNNKHKNCTTNLQQNAHNGSQKVGHRQHRRAQINFLASSDAVKIWPQIPLKPRSSLLMLTHSGSQNSC